VGGRACWRAPPEEAAQVGDWGIKSPSLVRPDLVALTRFGEVTLGGQSNAKSPRRHPTLADGRIVHWLGGACKQHVKATTRLTFPVE